MQINYNITYGWGAGRGGVNVDYSITVLKGKWRAITRFATKKWKTIAQIHFLGSV